MDRPIHLPRVHLGAALLVAAASLTSPLRADTVGMGTVWYDDVALSGQANSGPNYGFWAPTGNASLTGFTFTTGDANLTNDGTAFTSGQMFLQNLVMVNATSGSATTAYITVIDTSNNTVVGASSNAVSLAPSGTQSAGTPWRFDSLGLDAGKRYAFVFTSTAGVAGTVVNALGADGAALGTNDIDPSGNTLTVVNYRVGGLTSNQSANRIAGSGVFGTGTTTGGFGNSEQWFSAGLTTTSQSLTTIDGTSASTTQASALTLASGMRKIGTGTYTLSSTFANNIQGDIFVEQGSLRVATAANGATSGVLGSGQVYLINANPAGTAVTQNSATMSGTLLEINTAAGNATLDTAVEGAGNIHVTGANTLTVTSTNSNSGRFQVTSGTVAFSDVANLGVSSQLGRGNASDSSILLTGGTLLYTGSGSSTNRRVGFGTGTSAGTILSSGSGALQFTSGSAIGYNGVTGARTVTLGGTYVGDANVFGNAIGDNSGSTSLVKTGAGTWALTGTNTYTGTLSIDEGTLSVGNGGGSGTLGSGAVTIASGATLAINRTGGFTLSAAIGGSGDVIKSANGEVAFSGANTFTGTLTVDGGKVAFLSASSAGSPSSVVLGSGGTISLGSSLIGNTLTLANLSGSGRADTLYNAGSGIRTLAVDSGVDTTFSGTFAEDAAGGRLFALNKIGSGKLTLSGASTFTGGVTLTAGILEVANDSALGQGGVTAAGGALSGTATLANNLSLASNLSVGDGDLTLSGIVSEAAAGKSLSKNGTGTLTLAGVNTYTGATEVLAGRLALATGASIASSALVIHDGAELETVDGLDLSTGKSLLLGSGNDVAAGTHVGTFTLSGGSLALDFAESSNDLLAVQGDLSLQSGALVFTKSGTYSSGTYTLLSYTGAYTEPASPGDLTLSGLASDGTSRQTFGLNHDSVLKQVQLLVGGVAQDVKWTGLAGSTWEAGAGSSANWQVTSDPLVADADLYFNGDTVTFDDTASTGSVRIGFNDLTPVSVSISADTLDYTIDSDGGVINGGSLTKSGAATLTLASGHTFAGGVTLAAGRLRVGDDAALGTGTLTVSGGRLSAVGTDARTLSNAIQVAADFSLGASSDDTGELTLSGAINLGGAARTLTVDSGVTLSGSMSNGSLVKSGSGTLSISGANTLSVTTTVADGTLALAAADTISDVATVSVSSGATLDLGGFSEGLGTLALANGSTLTNGTLTSGTVTLDGVATLGAALSGTVSLTKTGNSTLALTSASARSGSTTIEAGTLLVGDAAALGSGALVLNGGTLALSDATARSLSNAVTVGGNLTLGAAGSGLLTLAGNIGLGSASRALELVSDVRISGVISSGGLIKSGLGTLTLSGSNSYASGTTLVSGAIVTTASNGLGTSGVITVNTAETGAADTSLGIDASGGSVTISRAISVADQGTGQVTLGSVAAAAGAQSIFSGAITLAKSVNLYGAGGDRTEFSGGISGTGDVRVASASGARVIFRASANTFSGGLTVAENSILQLSDGSSTSASLIPDATVVTLESGAQLRFAKGGNSTNEVVAGFAGSGTITAISGNDRLEISHSDNQTMSVSLAQNGGTLALTKSGTGTLTFDGTYGLTTGLTVSAGTMVFANSVNLAATTTVRGKLVFQADSLLGDNLANSGTNTDAEVDFGSNTLTIGTSSNGAAYYGKLTGTGTLALRGGSGSVASNLDGSVAGNNTGNRQVWAITSAGVIQGTDAQFFALDTGESLANRRDFIFANDTGEALVLSSFSGYGAIRGDWGGTVGSQVIRSLIVDQDVDTIYNGALLSHRSSTGAQRALSLTKRGSGTLELAGFLGKQIASAGGGASGVYLAVEEGVLDVTNPFNTTTSTTSAIDLATVTVSGGTLGFAAQALLNNAGTAGATSIVLDGGTLRWNEGNTQDISVGGRLQMASGKAARLDVGANDVVLSVALGGAADGSLVKLGSGSLTVSAANTFTGGVTLSAGTLVAGDAAAFGTGDILLSAGTLDFNNLDVLNRVIFAGGTLINVRSEGAVAIDTDGLTAAEINALDVPAIAAGTGATLDLAGVTKNVVVTGAANLSGLASFAGTLAVSGALDLSNAGNRPAAAALELREGGSIDFGQAGFSGNITYKGGAVSGAFSGNLNVSGAVTLTSANIGSGKVVVGSTHSVALDTGFAGTVRLEGGSVTAGLEDFSGSLELGTGGSLDLTNEPSPLAAVVVDDGGVLRGTGSVASLTVNSGGLLAPGNSPGLTTVDGNLVLLGGGSLDMEVQSTGAGLYPPTPGSDYDSVVVLGDLDLTGLSVGNAFIINLISLSDATTQGDVADFDPLAGVTYDIIAYQNLVNTYGGSITDLFQLDTTSFTYGGLPVDANLFSLVHNTGEQKIQLVYAPIPEPSTYGLMLGGLALVGAALRRRRRKD